MQRLDCEKNMELRLKKVELKGYRILNTWNDLNTFHVPIYSETLLSSEDFILNKIQYDETSCSKVVYKVYSIFFPHRNHHLHCKTCGPAIMEQCGTTCVDQCRPAALEPCGGTSMAVPG